METPWPDSARLAVVLLIELPDSQLDSADIWYGLDAGLPRLLRLLAEYQVKAGVLVRSDLCETRPELLQELAQRGHELLAYATADSLESLLEQLQQASGFPVSGACETGALETADAASLLAAGFRYRLTTARSEMPQEQLSEVGPLLNLPMAPDLTDAWLLTAVGTDAWLQYLIDSFDTLYEESSDAPLLLSLLLHPEIIGRPGRIKALEQFLQYLTNQTDIWIAPPGAVALAGLQG